MTDGRASASGEPGFDEIYARAGSDLNAIPWAALAPQPTLVAWPAARTGRARPAARTGTARPAARTGTGHPAKASTARPAATASRTRRRRNAPL